MTLQKSGNAGNDKITPISQKQKETQEVLESILGLDLKQCHLTICLAAAQEGSDVPLFRRARLGTKAADEFREGIDVALEPWQKALAKGNLVLTDFSADSVLEDGVVEYLSISDYESIKQQIAPLEMFKGLERFEADEKVFVQNLRFYAVVLEPPAMAGFKHPVRYYRWYSRTFLLRESSQHAIFWRSQEGVYDAIEEPVFLFDRHIDCFSCGDHMFVLQKFYFYTIFRFMEALKQTGERALDDLEAMDFIHNFSQFRSDCGDNRNKLLILSRIYHKPYFHQLDIDSLTQMINEYQLPITVRLYNGKKKMLYSSRQPWDILHLLDDSYADSPLTDLSYQVKGKREVNKARQTTNRITRIRGAGRSH